VAPVAAPLPDAFVWSYGYLAAFCFFVPAGGVLVCMGSLLFSKLFPRWQQQRYCIGSAARVRHPPDPACDPWRRARLRAQLGNTRAPLPERMTALVAMQSMPTRTASPVLRELLADSTDDIRPLAYGMLDGAEKQLTQKILAELPRLERPTRRRRAGRSTSGWPTCIGN
jgi:hypothetical protein